MKDSKVRANQGYGMHSMGCVFLVWFLAATTLAKNDSSNLCYGEVSIEDTGLTGTERTSSGAKLSAGQLVDCAGALALGERSSEPNIWKGKKPGATPGEGTSEERVEDHPSAARMTVPSSVRPTWDLCQSPTRIPEPGLGSRRGFACCIHLSRSVREQGCG